MVAFMIMAAVMAAIGHVSWASALELFLVNGVTTPLKVQLKYFHPREDFSSFIINPLTTQGEAGSNVIRVHVEDGISIALATIRLSVKKRIYEYNVTIGKDMGFRNTDEGAFIIWIPSLWTMSGPSEHLFKNVMTWKTKDSIAVSDLGDVQELERCVNHGVTTYALGSAPLLAESLPKPKLQDTVLLAASSPNYTAFIHKFRSKNGSPFHTPHAIDQASTKEELDKLIHAQKGLQRISSSVTHHLFSLDPQHTHLVVPQFLRLKDLEAQVLRENLVLLQELQDIFVSIDEDNLTRLTQHQNGIRELYGQQLSLVQHNPWQANTQAFLPTDLQQYLVPELHHQQIHFPQYNSGQLYTHGFPQAGSQQYPIPELHNQQISLLQHDPGQASTQGFPQADLLQHLTPESYHHQVLPQTLFNSQQQWNFVQDISQLPNLSEQALGILGKQRTLLEELNAEQRL